MANVTMSPDQLLQKIGEQHMIITYLEQTNLELRAQINGLFADKEKLTQENLLLQVELKELRES